MPLCPLRGKNSSRMNIWGLNPERIFRAASRLVRHGDVWDVSRLFMTPGVRVTTQAVKAQNSSPVLQPSERLGATLLKKTCDCLWCFCENL